MAFFVQRVTTRRTRESRAQWHSVELREWEDYEVRSAWGEELEDLARQELLLKETVRGWSVRPKLVTYQLAHVERERLR